MINKKALIIVGLSTILISSLSVGVFSKYSSTIDGGTGDVTAKKFVIKSDINDSIDENDIKLSPGEYKVKNFSIQNYDNGDTSEVNATVLLSVKWTSDIVPLRCELFEIINSTPVSLFCFTDGVTYSNEELSYQYAYRANTATTNNFQLKISWTDSTIYTPEDYIDSTASYEINVNALQGNTTIPSETSVLLTAFSDLFDGESESGSHERSLNDYFNKNKSSEFNGSKLTIVDSSGTNWGQKHASPALEEILGLDKGTFASKAAYKIVRYPKVDDEGNSTYNISAPAGSTNAQTLSKPIKNTNWYYDIYYINQNINSLTKDAVIDNVYHLDCSDLKIYRGSCLAWSGNADAGANNKLNVKDDLTYGGYFEIDESFTPIDFSSYVA